MDQTYNILGMKCEGCKNAVEKALGAIDGVKKVIADPKKGIAEVIGEHNADAVVDAVKKLGFNIPGSK